MNRFLILALAGLFSQSLLAQQITVSSSQLDFGVVLETAASTQAVAVTNPSQEVVVVKAMLPEMNGYSVIPDSLILSAGSTDSFFVTFLPRHNVYHNQELLLLSDQHLGAVSLDLLAQGRYSKVYYSTTENLSGEPLKAALKTRLAQGYTQLSYNAARDQMFMIIDNQKTNGQGAAVNTLECVYTGTQVTSYTDRTDAQLMGFNTEHTFPQGFFSQNLPMRSDIHHLFPTTESSNSERANNQFGVVTNPSWQVGGSKSNGSKFEPRDVHKGAVARALFYFVIRYQDYASHVAPQEAILRQWFDTYPPTAIDQARNNGVFTAQGNRNPFVDYPQFIERISKISGTATVADVVAYQLPEVEINFDTITGPRVYHFPIVNTGNVALTLEAPFFDDSRLSESSSLTFPYTLDPGEDLPLAIALQTTGDVGLDAQMTINITGGDPISVPVKAFWTLEAGIHDPWPAQWLLMRSENGFEIVCTGAKLRNWKLLDINGREIQQGQSNSGSCLLPMNHLGAGSYLIGMEEGGSWKFRRVMWRE
ncbi:MAG: endonuclease [Bacteroidia bacterium]|nr:endonuclease [Bacteroidia bacterium]